MSPTYTQALRIARDALASLIFAGKAAKEALDAGIARGEPVHPQSGALTFPLSTASEALDSVKSALGLPIVNELPPLPPPKASFPRYVALVGGGSLCAGDYFSPHAMTAYGMECRRTMTGTPAMTRAQAKQLARRFAHEADERHSYMPNNAIEAASWQPHEWVIAAILSAANGGDAAQQHPTCASAGRCREAIACPPGRCVKGEAAS